ncbi:neurobeachin-like protein 2 isoform X2 [Pipistrellus kuhlii]|uniref:Neurobeachin-like protein 2 n=1 Tax=Pipistrellus kuhlii TaxID=59472 RepID=A0A7J7R2H7_PIPKU|nr:neurobeachin-like protein 2 isoform X2 [Pipistrellus kuhlii]KAF6270346.1 neurobeachin like 2 [Pipistrellus kuhlii]
MAAPERLCELWPRRRTQEDPGSLQQWLKAYVGAFEESISLSSLEPRRREEAGAAAPPLPPDALRVLAEQLDQGDLEQSLLLLKLFAILGRNPESLEAGCGQALAPRVLALLTRLVAQLRGRPPPPEGPALEEAALHALLLCERLFDPHQARGEVVGAKEKGKRKLPPAALPAEFGAFFAESLQEAERLPPTLLLRLLQLFGAVLAGGKENGQLALSTGSLQGLLGVVHGWGRGAQDPRLVALALEALVGAVHVLHASRTPHRGPELHALLEGYFRVLNADWPAGPGPGPEEALVSLRVAMLDAIPRMLACEDRPVLQATFLSNNCFEHLLRLIQNSKLYLQARAPPEGDSDLATRLLTEPDVQKVLDQDSDAIAVHVVKVLTCVMSGSPSAKEVFKERIGYPHLHEVLQSHGPPTHRLLQELLNMAVEGDHSACPPPPVRNEQPVLVLTRWLPALPAEQQLFLAQRLARLCDSGPASRATCVRAGLVGCLLETLGAGAALGARCRDQLLALLQALGRVSLRPRELRRLLRPPPGLDAGPGGAEAAAARHAGAVIRVLSGMARPRGPARALHYFDLTPGMAGIMVPPVQRWPGTGFTFHAWLCLHPPAAAPALSPARRLQRKQLYSFFTSSGSGFEAFFTAAGTLVVAVCTRKEYLTLSLPEVSFADSAWHCVAVVHVPGWLFSQNLVHVYKDGHLVKTAPLRCPSLTEPFSSCCIGSAGHRTTTTTTGLPAPAAPTALAPTHPSLTRSQSVPATAGLGWGAGLGAPPQEGSISSTLAGTQDTRWGSPTSLEGELGAVAIFHEALPTAALQALCSLGPNETAPFKPEGDLHELGAKLLLHYSPQACQDNMCLDLSPGHGLDGRLTGHRVETWDVKDVVSCVGGMGALLPLLERVAAQPLEAEAGPAETHDLVGPELTSGHNTPGLPLALNKSPEERMERNAVAAFLLMLRNFLQGHPVNQESLVQCQGPAILGALLRKVPGRAMDMNVLLAAQLLMEQAAAEGSGPLLYPLYHHLLFHFHLWALSDFPVRLGHAHYLASVVRRHRQKLQKKYGVQFILDALHAHYSSQRECPLAADELRTVQTSLLELVQDLLARGSLAEDLQVVLSFLAAAGDAGLVLGALNLLLALLHGSPAQELVAGFLLEPGNLEVLLALLVRPWPLPQLPERICKVLRRLQQSEHPAEHGRQRLRLREGGLQGLVACLPEGAASLQLCQGLYKLFLGTDCLSLSDLMAVVQLSLQADLSVRLDICRKLFHLFYGQPDVVRLLARQAGWQDVLARLYVLEAAPARSPPPCAPGRPASPEPAPPRPPSESPEPADVFLPAEGPGPDPDAFYHALSPFSPPLDLGLERSSVDSGNIAGGGGSGTLTPASQPGTPSPLDGPRPFPPAQGRHSSSLSNVLGDGSLPEPSTSGDDASNTSNPQQPPEEELCNLLTNMLFLVTWRGVEDSDEAAWRERGQVFSVLTQLGASATLVRPPDCIKRSLLEMMLESALSDIKEASATKAASVESLAGLTGQVLWLLRLLQDFLHSEGHGSQELWSEKLFEGVCNLLDRLGAWSHLASGTGDLREMARIGLHLVLGYILLEDPQLHAQAYVRLHSLLQTAVPMRREEACYVLSKLEAALARALGPARCAAAAGERCSWLVPLVRTLLDRAYGPLGLQWGLPSLPPTNGSPTFFEDFQAFCATPEWRHFIDKQVQPTMSQFEMDTYAKSHDLMSGFWNSCYDTLMSSGQRRQRERALSRQAFQELVLEPVQRRARQEALRFGAALKQQAAQLSTALLHWGALWRRLCSPCGAWALRDPPPPRWKMSRAETYSRMRLKLVPNHHFNAHLEASALRDNLGEAPLTPTEEAALPLAVTREAKVSSAPEELPEDQLGEDELASLETAMEAAELDEQHEKLVLSAECQLVTVVAVVPGLLEVTTQHIYFYDGSAERAETEEGIGHDFRRPLAQLREVYLRRFNLRRSALELFFVDQANYFLNFPSRPGGPRPQPGSAPPHTQLRNQVYKWLLRLRPPTHGYLSSRSPQEMLRASGLTQKWVQREISNFEYLMQLNTIAGRTYNDLSQYPVFPWVLQDYVSPTLDLSNPAVFRDLSKPIGVVNPKHAQLVREKYESFEDPAGTIDKFHYGTHYSNAAGVMHYLIRMEPFTSLHVQLQSGRFDCSDRQFHSVAAAWQARLDSLADVKELIPEFFYFPDFLENQNGFDLGCLQLTNEKVGDVVLPPWASSPEDFIQQHRQALESEHVSAHLHEWIDLIFGYKQRGPAAEEALNVFYYCTYEGAVDLDQVTDERERKALEGIISNFGQTPCQLLREPHPARLSAEEAAQRLARLDTSSPSIFQHLGQLRAFFAELISDGVPLVLAMVPHRQLHSSMTPDLLVTVSANGLLGTHSWSPYDRNISNYFRFIKDSTKGQRLLSGPWVPGGGLSGQALAVAPDGKLLFSGGHWDGSLCVTALPRGKLLSQIHRHLDIVTCLALDSCGLYLISGSRDTTCLVWQLLHQGGVSVGLAPKPIQVLYGHEAAVSCVAISTELDMAVSGSEDGAVIIHTVRRGQFVAALRPPGAMLPGPVSHLALGSEGQIVVQSSARERLGAQVTYALHLYSVNGRLRASLPLGEQPTALAVTEDFALLGTAQCALHILHLNKLLPAAPPLPMKVPIRSMAVTKERSHVLVGLEDGKLIVVGAGQPSKVRSGQFARKLWRSSSRRISQVSSGETEYRPEEAR